MKVFNWVHRRFLHVHTGTSYLQKDYGLEKEEVRSKADVEPHALLEHGGHVLVDSLQEWQDGILAIGTLAVGPLETKHEIEEEENHEENNNNHDQLVEIHDSMHPADHNDDLEERPLMKMAFIGHGMDNVDVDPCSEIEEVGEDRAELKEIFSRRSQNYGCQTRRRVTLADLLSEDSDHHLVQKLKETEAAAKNNAITAKPNLKIDPTSPPKNDLSKAKKRLVNDFRPLKKVNQLMRRMVKKKIHPDLEGKTQKKDIQMQPITAFNNIPTTNKEGPNYPASLAIIQDYKA